MESYDDKEENLESDKNYFNLVHNESVKNQTETNTEFNKTQLHDVSKTHVSSVSESTINIGTLEQQNKNSSKLIEDIASLDLISGTDDMKTQIDSSQTSHILDTYKISETTNTNLDIVTNNSNQSTITVTIEDKDNVSVENDNKQEFKYGESLKTPNPDLDDKKLNEPIGYMELEPATPLLYEHISKDLSEPYEKPLGTKRKDVSENKENYNIEERENSVKFMQNTLNDDDNVKEDNEKSEDIIEEMTNEENCGKEFIPKSEDFIRVMLTGSSNTEGIDERNKDLPSKSEDYHQETQTKNQKDQRDISETMHLVAEKIIENKDFEVETVKGDDFVKDKTTGETDCSKATENKIDVFKGMVSYDPKDSNDPKSEDFLREMIHGNEKSNTSDKTDFIRGMIRGDTEKELLEDLEVEQEGKDTSEQNQDVEGKVAEPNELNSETQKQTHEMDEEAQKKQHKEVENHDTKGTTHSPNPKDDGSYETNNVREKIDNAPSISFLSEIPNVAEATNNFMNQIVDAKPKTPQLHFMEDYPSKQGKEKEPFRYQPTKLVIQILTVIFVGFLGHQYQSFSISLYLRSPRV